MATSLVWFLNPSIVPIVLAPSPSATAITSQEVGRVSLIEAKEAYDQDLALFLDVRSSNSFEESHIPGAVSIPLNELENRLGELSPSDWIITYCT